MNYNLGRSFPPFMIGDHDQLTIGGKAFRLAYLTQEAAILKPSTGDGVAETFAFDHLRRLNSAGKITHEIEYFLPEDMRTPKVKNTEAAPIGPVSRAARDRMEVSYAMAQVAIHLQDHEDPSIQIGKTDHALGANMMLIRELAADYLYETLPDPEHIEKIRLYRAGEGRKPKGGKAAPMPDAVHPSTLRKWIVQVRKHGKNGLIPAYARRGYRSSYFTPEEKALLASVVKEAYLTPQRISIAATVQQVADAFAKKNKTRDAEGLSKLRTPSREAVRQYIRKLDAFATKVARHGRSYAMKTMKPVGQGQGQEITRPLQQVQIDEWCVDVVTLMAEGGLLEHFTEEEIEALALKGGKGRWWLAVAIDVRTRVILAMRLVYKPRSSAAVECLRMVTEDKGAFADAVGAVSPWSQFGTPEVVLTDNGVFKSTVFTNCCAALGITFERTIAGQPQLRGVAERFFHTAITGVCSRLSGRTFSNALERGDYDAGARACLTTDDLCFALVRWVVDVYHNTPHEGLGGRTPLEQWEFEHEQGNYPLHAAPSKRRKRLAFGLHLKRRIQKDGLTILGVRYHSAELAEWLLHKGSQDLEVRWDHADLGAIEVYFNEQWNEVETVHETADGERMFDGLTADEWIATRRALAARSEERKAWNADTVATAIAEILAMNKERQLAVDMVDKNWNLEDFGKRESALFAGFNIGRSKEKTRATSDGYGRSIEPVASQAPMSSPEPQKANRWTKKD